MPETLVRAQGVSKKFCRSLKRSMLYGFQDIAKSSLGIAPRTQNLKPSEFWALDDISFELERGQCLGLIGPNGSGKSTLLKMLNGIISPDRGRVEINGKVGALIEVGAGFHPMLTGRENIYINGSILGLSKRDIDKKFEEIVDFAELSDFIDTPVKNYSSGMYVRLGFSIAAHIQPDVLLIDEILAVGDVGFKAKCFNAISRLADRSAIVFVSHAMPQITRMCDRVCVLQNGKISYCGTDVPGGISRYFSCFKKRESVVTGSGRATIHDISMQSNGSHAVDEIDYLADLTVRIDATVDADIQNPVFNLAILTQDLSIVAQSNSAFSGVFVDNRGTPMQVGIHFPSMNLCAGIYYLSASIHDETMGEVLIQHYAVKSLKINGNFTARAAVQLVGDWKIQHL